MSFSGIDEAGLNDLLDLIIPPDPQKGLPGASQVGFQPDEEVWKILKILDDAAIVELDSRFHELSHPDRVTVVNSQRKSHPRLFSWVAKHVVTHYYQQQQVRRVLSLGESPPFPEGYSVEEGDLTLLEDVYFRGSIYRHV